MGEQDPEKLTWSHENKPSYLQGDHCMVLSWKDLEILWESPGNLGLFCGSYKIKLLLFTPIFKVSLFIQNILMFSAQWLTRTESPKSRPRSISSCPGHHDLVGHGALENSNWKEQRNGVERQAWTVSWTSGGQTGVPNGTDEIPKEFQYSFQLRHCLDYCKFCMGPELMMPHGHSHINPFVFGSSFRILSKLFSHFWVPLFS